MNYAYEACTESLKKCPLSAEMGLDTLRLELNRIWDGVMLFVAQNTTDTHVRNAYRLLIQQARFQTDVLQWLDTPEVFYSTGAAKKGKRRIPWCGLLGAVVLAGLTVWFAVPHQERNVFVACLTGGVLMLTLIQYLLLHLSASKEPTAKIHTEQRVSPERMRNSLLQLAQQVDSNADSLCAIMIERTTGETALDLSLAQELMRLPADKRGTGVTEAVDRFLIRQGVEKVEYSPDRSELFMVLPSSREMTVEPALIKDDMVLQMGVACTLSEE